MSSGGEQNFQQNCWIWKKKSPKFFGYVESSVVSWILSLSKNVTRVFPRTHPGWGGTRTLNRTLAFNKKFNSKFFGYVYSSVVSTILSLWKNFTGLFCRTHPRGNRTLNRTVGFEKKNLFEIFWVCSKYCSFLDLKFKKILRDLFVELIRRGGSELSTELLDLKKKIPWKFFGYVQSTVVSRILSLSKNVTTVFPRTPLGGTRKLNRTLAFNKKFPSKFFGYV